MSHQLETIIGYKFKNPELLETALTHTSYANESRTPVKHNERLEFLGDSVLQIVSADYLFHAYADRPEGDLTRIRASLVSEGFHVYRIYVSSIYILYIGCHPPNINPLFYLICLFINAFLKLFSKHLL